MNIQPTPSGPQPRTGAQRLKDAAPGTPVRADSVSESGSEAAHDLVELSTEARELNGMVGTGDIPAGSIPSDRLRTVLDRLAQGFYDRTEVRNEVLRRITRDLGLSS